MAFKMLVVVVLTVAWRAECFGFVSDDDDALSLLQVRARRIEADDDGHQQDHNDQTKVENLKQQHRDQAPDQAEQDDVNQVWSTMRSWGGLSMGAARIGMYMKGNAMTMDKTSFSFAGSLPAASLLDHGHHHEHHDKQHMPPPAPAPPQPDNTLEMAFGPLRMGRYMKDDSLTMADSTLVMNGASQHEDSTVVASLVQESGGADGTSRLFDDTLSMDATIFTMNVGTGTSLLQSGEASASIGTLNINMYMYDNTMKMTGTDFTMNVKSLPFSGPITMQNAGKNGICLAQLLLLTTAQLSDMGASSTQSASSSPSGEDPSSVWSWLTTWSQSSNGGMQDATIEMRMFNNEMSMDNTVFTMNVGSDAGSLLSSSVETVSGSADAQASNSSNLQDTDIYSSDVSMQDTQFTISVASLLQEKGERTPGPGQDLKMEMYKNKLEMSDTIFTMNVGTQDSSLLQKQARLSDAKFKNAKRAMMNVASLNVNMYMYSNQMGMENTVFKWTVG